MIQNTGSLAKPLPPSPDEWKLFPPDLDSGLSVTEVLLHRTGNVISGLSADAVGIGLAMVGAIGNSDFREGQYVGLQFRQGGGVEFIKADNHHETLTDGARKSMKSALVDFLGRPAFFQNGSLFNRGDSLGSIVEAILDVYEERDKYKINQSYDANKLAEKFGLRPGIDVNQLHTILELIENPDIDIEGKLRASIDKLKESDMLMCVGESGEGKSTLTHILVDGNAYRTSVNDKSPKIDVLGLPMDKPANILCSLMRKEIPYHTTFACEVPAYDPNGHFPAGFLRALGLTYNGNGKTPLIEGFPDNYLFTHQFIEDAITTLAPNKIKICYPVKTGLEESYAQYEPLREFLRENKDGLDNWIEKGFPKMQGREVELYFDYFCRLSQHLPASFLRGLNSGVFHNAPFIPIPTPVAFKTPRLTKNHEARYIQDITKNTELTNFTNQDITDKNYLMFTNHIDNILKNMGKHSEYLQLYRFAQSIYGKFAHRQGVATAYSLLGLTFSLMVMEANYKEDENNMKA
jgi:hypothetical protein